AVIILVRSNRSALLAILIATAGEMVATALRYVDPNRSTDVLDFAAAVVFLSSLTVVLAFVVFGPGHITVYRIVGAIAIYLNIAIVFAATYRLIDILAPGAFSPPIGLHDLRPVFSFIYFSFETITTLGFGDILPVHPFARSLVTLEAFFGQLFPAI